MRSAAYVPGRANYREDKSLCALIYPDSVLAEFDEAQILAALLLLQRRWDWLRKQVVYCA